VHDPVSARPWLLVGCGYTGTRVAERLVAAGAEVVVARRRADDAAVVAAGLGPRASARAIDLDAPATLAGAIAAGAVIVHLAPPGSPPGAGEEALVRAAVAAGAHRLVYVSSTGVYAAGGGAWVDESWPLAPITSTGADRLAAELALTAAAAGVLDAVVLRACGIYGPGRGVAARIRAGSFRIVGERDTAVSRIHVDDLAAAVILAGTAQRVPSPVYNVADRDPAPSRVVGEAIAAALGVPLPPTVAAASVSAEVSGMLTADRKIDARRLERELGWQPAFPSWRDGLADELAGS